MPTYNGDAGSVITNDVISGDQLAPGDTDIINGLEGDDTLSGLMGNDSGLKIDSTTKLGSGEAASAPASDDKSSQGSSAKETVSSKSK